MTEDQTPYNGKPVNDFESSEIFYCPGCGRSLIEYNGVMLGIHIICPGCGHVIVSIDCDWPPRTIDV